MLIKIKKQRKKHWWQNISVTKANTALLALWIIACAAYVATLNDMTARGYKAKKLEKQLSELSDNYKEINLSVSGKQSMEMVVQKVRELGLVEAGSVKYVAMPASAVAKK